MFGQLLETLINCWQHWATPGNFKHVLVICWELLATLDNFWQLMARVGNFGQLLAIFGNLWQPSVGQCILHLFRTLLYTIHLLTGW